MIRRDSTISAFRMGLLVDCARTSGGTVPGGTVPGLPNFLTRDSVNLSISHSPRPLSAGPIRNAEKWNLS